jgi:hypothetical protein
MAQLGVSQGLVSLKLGEQLQDVAGLVDEGLGRTLVALVALQVILQGRSRQRS